MIELTKEQIIDWVSKHFPEYKIRSSGKQICVNNPYGGDSEQHLWISTESAQLKNRFEGKSGYWVHDFRPGHQQYDGSLVNFVRKYLKVSYRQAISELVGKGSIRYSRRNEQNKNEPEHIIQLPTGSKPISNKSSDKVRLMMLDYLAGRCVTEEIAIEHDLYYSPDGIVFPYIEYGEIVYWQERSILNKRFNFPNEENTGRAKTDYLYNFDNVEASSHLIIVESIFNCISVGMNCVASGGATISGKQPEKVRALDPKIVVLAPDNDEPDSYGKRAGVESLKKNYFLLKDRFDLAFTLPPAGIKDWNEMDQKLGIGSAKRYISDNVYKLTIPNLMKILR